MSIEIEELTSNSYLKDESGLCGQAEFVVHPVSKDEIREVLLEIQKRGIEYTIQGARTGIEGRCIPKGGCVVDLSLYKEKFQKNEDSIIVSSGITFREIQCFLLGSKKWLPFRPTEMNATVGGAIMSDSYGVSSYKYGKIRDLVIHLEVLRNNSIIELEQCSDLENDDIICEAVLQIADVPESQFGIFVGTNGNSESFINEVHKMKGKNLIAGIEYYNKSALLLGINSIEQNKTCLSKEYIASVDALVYIELHGKKADIFKFLGELMPVYNKVGIDDRLSGILQNTSEIDKLLALRHCIVEAWTIGEKKKNIPILLKHEYRPKGEWLLNDDVYDHSSNVIFGPVYCLFEGCGTCEE